MNARERLIEFMVNNTPLPEEEVIPLVDEVEAESYAAGFDDAIGPDNNGGGGTPETDDFDPQGGPQ